MVERYGKKDKRDLCAILPCLGSWRMRYLVVVSAILAVYGVGFVCGSVLTVPYTVRERVRIDRSRTWVDDAFILMPSQNYTRYGGSSFKNESIYQVDVESSDLIVTTILSVHSGEVWFTIETRRDATFFWTQPQSDGYFSFVFLNPSSVSVSVTARVTEFYLKSTEYRDFTYYRPFLDSIYGYSGIMAIIMGTALNIVGELLPRAHSTSSTQMSEM